MKEINCTYKGELYSVREDGSVFRHPRPGKKPRPYDSKWTFGNKSLERGYMEIASVQVHRIVATAFHGEAPSPQHVVDHKDTNKCNNRPENLRWVTKFENIMLNPITVKRIEWVIGDKIEKFLEDPAKYKDKFQDQNFAWMRSVSAEEGKLTLERLQDWAASDKQPSGGTLGEWIYSRGSWYDDVSQVMPSENSNASQRNWKRLFVFPFCPPSVEGDPIAAYMRRLGPGNAFAASENKISVAYHKTMSADGSILYVIAEWQYRNNWVLAKITYENDKFVHENLGTFPELEDAKRKLAEAQGIEWKAESAGEGEFRSGTKYDQLIEELSNTIASKTPGAVQRNWKTVSGFPNCPTELKSEQLENYAHNLVAGSVFAANLYGSYFVVKAEVYDGATIIVITESKDGIKRYAMAKVYFEDGVFVHESAGTFFELRGAERALCEAKGLEWTGEDGIDDYC